MNKFILFCLIFSVAFAEYELLYFTGTENSTAFSEPITSNLDLDISTDITFD